MSINFSTTSHRAITCGTSNSMLMIGTACTISIWTYITGNGENNEGFLIAKGSGGGEGIRLQVAGGSSLYFVVAGATYLVRANTNAAFSFNTWYNFLATWDGSTTAANSHIYINGTEINYNQTQNGVSLSSTFDGMITIGNRGSFARTFYGALSEAAVWNVELTTREIRNVASSRVKRMPLQIRPGNLQGYWPLDELSNDALSFGSGLFRDLSGRGNNGSPFGNPAPTGLPEKVLTY